MHIQFFDIVLVLIGVFGEPVNEPFHVSHIESYERLSRSLLAQDLLSIQTPISEGSNYSGPLTDDVVRKYRCFCGWVEVLRSTLPQLFIFPFL